MTARSSNMTTWVIGGAVLVVLLGVWLLLGRPEAKLGQSATGFQGLQRWLVANDVDARSFSGGYMIDGSEVGLRIAPLYDLDLNEERERPRTTEDLLKSETERDVWPYSITDKAQSLPTLFVIPKWTAALRLTGGAHTDFMNRERGVQALLESIVDGDIEVHSDLSGFSRVSTEHGEAVIYGMRTMSGDACTPVLGRQSAMLIGRCKLKADPDDPETENLEALILIDPDLLNNHGLSLGENAELAASLLPELAEEGNVLIDYAPFDWVMRDTGAVPEYERSWSDLGRYFQGPFAVLWASIAAAFLLALWRGWVRFGAAVPLEDTAPGAARSVATAAQARLLRISGDTGALLRAYADARIGALAADVFGTKAQASEAALWRLLERRAPQSGRVLRQEAAALRNHGDGGHAMADIDTFEEAIGQVRDELEK